MNQTSPAETIRLWFRKSLPFWLILPTIIVLLVVQVYPAIYTGWLSFQKRTAAGWESVGFENFKRLFKTNLFSESIGHTIIFLLGYTLLTITAGFIIAFLLKQNVRLSGVYITLLFIPWIIADIIAGLVFRLLVLPEYGLLNGILGRPELFPPDGLSVLTAIRPAPWFGDFPFPPSPGMIFLILAACWRALPFVTLLILAALQTVPKEVTESARIDGANGLRLTQYITVPLIMPAMVVALFNLILGGMNGVGMVFSLTGGGPGTTTYVLSYLLYTLGWSRLEFGQAAALAILIAIVNWILIMGVLRITRVNQRTR
ncbi:MAG: sugar ABC transporter permease [Anaerolineales bacterium]|nr:sugar ABC transporter permease [Anaerolineales bacterium]